MADASILIFGAGINQLELIQASKKLNLVSVVIDPLINPPGKPISDFYYQVDGNDYLKTKEIAIKHNVKGIVSGQMEKPMKLMAKLANELGFIYHTPEIVEKTTNKWLMKKSFVQNKVSCAKGLIFKKEDTIIPESLKDLEFPLIIKPLDSFSSRGVKKVSTYEDLKAHENDSRSYSSDTSIIIEEFLEGREFSVESITFKGVTTVIQITEKFITPYPNTVEIAHLQPARINYSEKKQIEFLVMKAVEAIGVDNSASHTEVMLTEKGPYIIEIGARLGGDFISSYLTKASTGISMDKAVIQIALGINPNVTNLFSRNSMIKYISLEPGKTVKKILPMDEIEEQVGYVFKYCFVKEGDIIKKITHSAERQACVLFESENLNSLNKRIDKAEKIIISNIILS